ncbi:glycosyltransferase WbuB [Bryobacterales bacterium F-183]|nr:glycosyltransferase WbuB [Bryobacterales bacterium F-183]
MRIAVFHQHYLGQEQGGGSRFNSMARVWKQKGHDVVVVAGSVNYAGRTGDPVRARDLFRREIGDGGVEVLRCWVPDTYSRSYLQRALAFLGYTLSATLASLFIERPDVIIATSPPLVAVVPAWIASKLRWRRIPWIFEVRDLWPESAITTGILSQGSLMTRILYRMEAFAAKCADRINVLTPAFRDDLVTRGLATPDKIVFVPNAADLDRFQPAPPSETVAEEMGWNEKKVFLYAGAHGRANALSQLLATAHLLKSRPDVLLACVGDGPERATLEETASREGLSNIAFYGPQPKTRMPALINAAVAGVAVLQNNPTFRTVYPNKVFDYMACAKPTVLGIDGVARDLVCAQAEAGLFATPEDAASLAKAILTLADNKELCERLGQSGLRWVRQNADRSVLAERYLDILSDLAGKPAFPSATVDSFATTR